MLWVNALFLATSSPFSSPPLLDGCTTGAKRQKSMPRLHPRFDTGPTELPGPPLFVAAHGGDRKIAMSETWVASSARS